MSDRKPRTVRTVVEQALSKAELEQLLKAIPDDARRQRLAIKVAFHHGLRAEELVKMTRESIADGKVRVERQKGSLLCIQPFVSVPGEILDEAVELRALYDGLQPGERLFQSRRGDRITARGLNQMLARTGEKIGLPRHKMHLHALKHSCVTSLLRRNVPLEVVREHVGHKSIASTGEYARLEAARVAAEVQAKASLTW